VARAKRETDEGVKLAHEPAVAHQARPRHEATADRGGSQALANPSGGRRLAELEFRRPTPIHPYILDFVCFEYRLIVEADGSRHAENRHDQERDAFLIAQGFSVLRFWNHDILHRPRMIEDTILARCGLPF
jgi:very-short-patch-repair endonuclease